MFENECRILYIKLYDFTDEKTNKNVKGANVSYTWVKPSDKDNEKGFRVMFGKLPYDVAVGLMNDLPCDIVGKFELSSSNELKLVDIAN